MSELISFSKAGGLPEVSGFIPKIMLGVVSDENPDCQIAATNDLEAADGWLHLYDDVPKTYDTYKREIQRLLLWCVYERGSYLKNLKVEDFENYFSFLRNPPFHWCASRSQLRRGRASCEWRPFVGPLSESAFLTAVRVLNSFLNYLVEARYVRSNPIKLMKKHRGFSMDVEAAQYRVWERMLEVDEWNAVQESLAAMPEASETEIANKMRTQFLFALGYLVGLRIHEIATHRWNAFRKLDGKWWLFIKGKGGKLRHIPVNDQLLSFMKVYRLSLGKAALPTSDEREPLFISKRGNKTLSIRQLYELVKAIGEKAAQKFEDKPLKAQKLRKFSAHWLRHMSASHQDKAGIPSVMIRESLGHSSEAVTKIYRHSEQERRHEEMQKIQLSITPRLIERKPTVTETIITLSFKGRPMDNTLSFNRVLDFIEEGLLQELEWERQGFTKEGIVKEFAHRKQYGEGIRVSYSIKEMSQEAILSLKAAILRECEIRLLVCEIIESLGSSGKS